MDPKTLLECLSMQHADEPDKQFSALEELCMNILMSNNVDRLFKTYPPQTFLPAIAKIFMYEKSIENVLEVAARAITYFLDASPDCVRIFVSIKGIITAICNTLATDLTDRSSRELAEQNIKTLEKVCAHEANAVFKNGGMNYVLTFIRENGTQVHKDTLHSAMAVITRLCDKVEADSPCIQTCVESLKTLLQHNDLVVSDGVLKCFAVMVNRYNVKCIDPAPLAEYGLVEELLRFLINAAGKTESVASSIAAHVSEAPINCKPGNTKSISTAIKLLWIMCAGSEKATNILLRSQLPQAIESSIMADDRCTNEWITFADLLLCFLFERRECISSCSRVSEQIRYGEQQGDENIHETLIDSLKSTKTKKLKAYMKTHKIDINYMDQYGQTLLNIAAAYGSLNVVKYLCEKGADPNMGQLGTSLHHAACFGRHEVCQTLLNYGANLEQLDEEGNTPLNKASERFGKRYQEVVALLKSHGTGLVKVNKDSAETESAAPRGDPEMASKFLNYFMALFCKIFQKTMLPEVRSGILNFIQKVVYYVNPIMFNRSGITQDIEPENLFVEVIASVLDDEDDCEGHVIVLAIIQIIMTKTNGQIPDIFKRLGIFTKVKLLLGDDFEVESTEHVRSNLKTDDQPANDEIPKSANAASLFPTTNASVEVALEDSKEILKGRDYHWHKWHIYRSTNYLYFWSDTTVLELPTASNGWFRFISNRKYYQVYTNGMHKIVQNGFENRGEIIENYLRARSTAGSDQLSQPICSARSLLRLVVGNWIISATNSCQLQIMSLESSQKTILDDNFSGFYFESNNKRRKFPNDTEFESNFTECGPITNKICMTKAEMHRDKARKLARQIYTTFFKNAQAVSSGGISKLSEIVSKIHSTIEEQLISEENQWEQKLQDAFSELSELLHTDEALSTFEMQSSGLVQVLLKVFLDNKKERQAMFRKCFFDKMSCASHNAISKLVKKLVVMLESIEKFPVIKYENSGGPGLLSLTKHFYFKLERDKCEKKLIDRSGQSLNIEPLATVGQLEKYLLKTVTKQWHEMDRNTFYYLKKLRDHKEGMIFKHTADFDENGLIYFIGSNAGSFEWVNPAKHGLVHVSCSDSNKLAFGKLKNLLARNKTSFCQTMNTRKSWFAIDLGVFIIPHAYTLGIGKPNGRTAPRNWILQGSKDGVNWATLTIHSDDQNLEAHGGTFTWPIVCVPDENQGFRHIRIQQNGTNSSGLSCALSLGGFEIYGQVVSICGDMSNSKKIEEKICWEREKISAQLEYIKKGARVVRAIDWRWENQDNFGEGTVVSDIRNDWVEVKWDHDVRNVYRMGIEGKYDIKLTNSMDSEPILKEDNGSLPEATVNNEFNMVARELRISTPGLNPLWPEVADNLQNSENPSYQAEFTDNQQQKLPVACACYEYCRCSIVFPQGPNSVTNMIELALSSNFHPDLVNADQNVANTPTNTGKAVNKNDDTIGSGEGDSVGSSDIPNLEQRKEAASSKGEEALADDTITKMVLAQYILGGKDPKSKLFQEWVSRKLPAFLNARRRRYPVISERSPLGEVVLKRQLAALIPVFDPRPGHHNINQTLDLEVQPPGSTINKSVEPLDTQVVKPKLSILLRVPTISGVPGAEIELLHSGWTIFRAVQEALQATQLSKTDKFHRIWEHLYTVVYKERQPPTETVSFVMDTESSTAVHTSCSVDNVLELLSHLNDLYQNDKIVSNNDAEIAEIVTKNAALSADVFLSKKITNKLQQQIQDTLVVSSNSLPGWCEDLTHSYPFLFPFEVRLAYFNSTTFGISRNIASLQSRYDQELERQRASGPNNRSGNPNEFRLGRLQHDRVKVPRDENLLQWAMQVMRMHCDRKTILEVAFVNEMGTGLGPTLEFYSLVATELQRADLCMWLCDNILSDAEQTPDSDSMKPPGYYVNSQMGLFPAPLPQDSAVCKLASDYFWFLGVVLAKALQDMRLIDLPFSNAFLQLLCQNRAIHHNADSFILSCSVQKPSNEAADEVSKSSWFDGILTIEHLKEIDPFRYEFIKSLERLISQKQLFLKPAMPRQIRQEFINSLKLCIKDQEIELEQMALTFTYTPSSPIYGYTSAELVPNGENIDVTIENVEEYYQMLVKFILQTGIAKQMEAFREGFSKVFPLEKMAIFTPEEARLMICGNQHPQWTREDLLNYTEPKLGYSKESPGFMRFVNVLMSMTGPERKAFLQFTTGCSSLPPGGLANLQPRLTIVRKVDAGEGSYPSVNTCVHYLKLPDYSSEEIMKERLLTATKAQGFHLN